MARKSAPLTMAGAIATSALLFGCSSGQQGLPGAPILKSYSTISATGGSTEPNTLIRVDLISGAQVTVGKVGATPEQFSLAWDARSGFLYGVNPFQNPGVITRIDPATGDAVAVATFPQQIGAIAFSPAGQMYAMVLPRTLARVDPSQGTLVVVGDVTGGDVYSLDFRSDGTLYGILQQPTSDQWLVTIDPATATTTSSVRLGPYTVGDIACAPGGFIYATNYSWALVLIDPKNGDQALVGYGGLGGLGGLAVVQ